MKNKKVRVNAERFFVPHAMLLSAAHQALERGKLGGDGYWYDWLNVMLCCSLSVEAVANAYGESFVENWRDFDSSSPLAKIRLVAEKGGIHVDFSKHPWSTVPSLIKFRNRVAHAKPEDVSSESFHHPDHYLKEMYAMPQSKLERMVSESTARRSLDDIYEILGVLRTAFPVEKVNKIEIGWWTTGASLMDSE